MDPIDNGEACHPHDNNVDCHLCSECMKSILPNVCRKPEPIRAKYKHFKTIGEHTFHNSPTDSSSSFLKWWSSKQGPEIRITALSLCSPVLVCLPSLLSRHPKMSPGVRIEVTLNEHPPWNKNSFHSYGIVTWPINSSAIKFLPVCPGMARIYNKYFWNSCNTGTSSCCFLHRCVEANPCPGIFALRTSEMPSAVLER